MEACRCINMQSDHTFMVQPTSYKLQLDQSRHTERVATEFVSIHVSSPFRFAYLPIHYLPKPREPEKTFPLYKTIAMP